MTGPCEHCANPDKALWPSECRYLGGYPTHAAFTATTADPPCSFDDYDEHQSARDRRLGYGLLIQSFVTVGLGVGAVWLLS